MYLPSPTLIFQQVRVNTPIFWFGLIIVSFEWISSLSYICISNINIIKWSIRMTELILIHFKATPIWLSFFLEFLQLNIGARERKQSPSTNAEFFYVNAKMFTLYMYGTCILFLDVEMWSFLGEIKELLWNEAEIERIFFFKCDLKVLFSWKLIWNVLLEDSIHISMYKEKKYVCLPSLDRPCYRKYFLDVFQ
jgi:hypothetical protein